MALKSVVTFFTLFCIFVLTLSACRKKEEDVPPPDIDTVRSTVTSTPKETTSAKSADSTAETSDTVMSAESETQTTTKKPTVLMPGDTDDFDNPFADNWLNVSFLCEDVVFERRWQEKYQEQFGMTYDEIVDETRQYNTPELWDKNKEENEGMKAFLEVQSDYWTMLDEFYNKESETIIFRDVVLYFDVSKEEFVRANKRAREYQKLTDEDIEVLFFGNGLEIQEKALNDWTILTEGEIYSAKWVMNHDPSDYARAGLTPEIVKEKLKFYAELELGDSVRDAFSEKLSEFIGEEVSLKEIKERNQQ